MNKVLTKRFALLAILLSLLLSATAFTLLGVHPTANAAGEIEIRFPTEFDHSCWTQSNRLDLPCSEQVLGGSQDNDTIIAPNSAILSKVKVKHGEQVYNPTHFRVDAKDFDIYFTNPQYDKSIATNGEQFIIEEGFTFTTGVGTFVCSETRTWTFNGTKWVGDFDEIPEPEEDLSAYTDMTVSMATSGRAGETPFYVVTDSASTTIGDDSLGLTGYVSMTFPDNTPANVWFCRVDKEEARFFVRPKNDPNANINAVSEIPVGTVFTVKRGFRLDSASALKEDKSFIMRDGAWQAYVPATAITVANESTLSVNNGATLQLNVALTPSDSNDIIYYEALDSGITVSDSGLVTGKAVGTSQVEITAGKASKTVSITVKTPPTVQSVSVNGTLEIYQYANITELSQNDSAIGALTGVYNYSDSTTDTFPIDKTMVTGWENVNTAVAGNYNVTVTKDSYDPVTATVTVKASDVLAVQGSGFTSGAFWVALSGSKATLAMNLGDNISAEGTEILNRMRPYVQASLQAGTANASDMQMQANYASGGGNRTVNLYWAPGGAVISYTKGDFITLKKGFPILESERLAEDVNFIFDGSQWVKLIEPTAIQITNKEEVLYAGTTHVLNVTTTPADATKVFTYTSSNTTYATVADGVITLNDVTYTQVTVTVKYSPIDGEDVTDSFSFTVQNEPVKTGIVLENTIPAYYVPVGSKFTDKYTLKFHYTYEGGKVSASTAVTKAQIDEEHFDFDTVGDRDLTVNIDEYTATVKVHVYELKTISWWQDLGVSGYGDNRNKEGEFNGNMVITARNFSSSGANFTIHGDTPQEYQDIFAEIRDMFDYITYTTKSGEVYTQEGGTLGGWLLGSTILVNAGGKGFTGEADHGYQLGDKITFAEDMPLYGWSGDMDATSYPGNNAAPKLGSGCVYVIGYTDRAYTWFCYDQNDDYSLWHPYVEYNGFNVRDSITITVEGVGSLGAMFTSESGDAVTTGYFTYDSSDTSVVTVNESGNLVGVKEGTAKITVTAIPIEASGYQMTLPAKEVTVTVKRGISGVSGSFTVKPGAKFDLDKYKVTVTYTDGTSEEIALSDERVQAEEVDTSVKGESTYVVMVSIDGAQKRGTFTVNVKNSKGCGCGGCGSDVASVGSVVMGGLVLVIALAAVSLRSKKKED